MSENILDSLEEFRLAKEYWYEKLALPMEEIKLPGDFFSSGPYIEATHALEFPKVISENLKKICKANDLSVYILLLTVLKIFIYKYIDRRDIHVLSPVRSESNRQYNSYILLRDTVTPKLSFKEMLMEVRQTVMDGYANEHYPLRNILKTLGFENGSFFTRIAILLENIHQKESVLSMMKEYGDGITLCFYYRETELIGKIQYNSSLFQERTIKAIFNYYSNILSIVLENTDMLISDIQLLSPEEKRSLLVELSNSREDFSYKESIHKVFEQQVRETPNNIVLCSTVDSYMKDDSREFIQEDGYIRLSYRDLNERAGRLAAQLKKNGVDKGQIVGLSVSHPFRLVIGILGILKVGGAYLPIDHQHPSSLIKYLLINSNVRVVVTESSTEEIIGQFGEDVSLTIISPNPDFHPIPVDYDSAVIDSENDPAYVIYTSGTTGKPKGVPVPHQGVINYAQWRIRTYRITQNDVALQLLSPGFDGFGSNFYSTILSGGTLFMVPDSRKMDVKYLGIIIEKCGITNVSLVPGLYQMLLDTIDEGILRSLRFVVLAGEACSPSLVIKSKQIIPEGLLINEYGPTETTIAATANFPITENNTSVIGRPIANKMAFILDSSFQLLPPGIPGELYIAGVGISPGYLNDPQSTTESFLENPFISLYSTFPAAESPMIADRIYRTGDFARLLPNGSIEFMGRVDHQVKIRGYRIELGAVQRYLESYPKIDNAVVLARKDQGGDNVLCAYFTAQPPEESVSISLLKDFLSEQLPEYMLPTLILQVPKIPITANGKVDMEALPEPGSFAGDQYQEPRTELEKKLAEIWSGVLEVDLKNIGIEEDFFALGGNSLKAVSLETRIHKELGVKISQSEIFKAPTIGGMSRFIITAGKVFHTAVEPAEKREYYPVSSAQRQMYIQQKLEPQGTRFNILEVVPLGMQIDKERLESTLIKVITRHESLRTSFLLVEEKPVQRIHESVFFEIEYRKENTDNFIKGYIQPFDLSRAPLIRGTVIEDKYDDSRTVYYLLVEMHHIISDMVSQQILVSDFNAIYNAETLPPLKLHYKDYALWRQTPLQQEAILEQEKFWLEKFRGNVPVLELPTDFSRPDALSPKGEVIHFQIPKTLVRALKHLATTEGASLQMVMLAVLYVLLMKLSGQEDIIVGVPAAGRKHADLENIIGIFINTLALRSFPSPDKTFRQFLKEVKVNSLEAYENQEYAFEQLVNHPDIRLERHNGRHVMFDIMFEVRSLQSDPDELSESDLNSTSDNGYSKHSELDENGDVTFTETNKMLFDMDWMGSEKNDSVYFSLSYSINLFERDTIRRIVDNYKILILNIVEKNDLKLKDLEYRTSTEKELDRVEDLSFSF